MDLDKHQMFDQYPWEEQRQTVKDLFVQAAPVNSYFSYGSMQMQILLIYFTHVCKKEPAQKRYKMFAENTFEQKVQRLNDIIDVSFISLGGKI